MHKIQYEITAEDLVEYNVFYTSASPTIARRLRLQKYLGFVIILTIPFLLYFFNHNPLAVFVPVFTIMGILWIFFYPKLIVRDIKRQVSKMIQEGNGRGTVGTHVLTLTPEEIIESWQYGEKRVSREVVKKIHSTDQYIFILFGSMMAFVIPKRGFADDTVCREFLVLLDEYYPNMIIDNLKNRADAK